MGARHLDRRHGPPGHPCAATGVCRQLRKRARIWCFRGMVDQFGRPRCCVVGVLRHRPASGTATRRITREYKESRLGGSVAGAMGSTGGVPYATGSRDQLRRNLLRGRTHVHKFQAFRGRHHAGCHSGDSPLRLPRPLRTRACAAGDGYLVRSGSVRSCCRGSARPIASKAKRSE